MGTADASSCAQIARMSNAYVMVAGLAAVLPIHLTQRAIASRSLASAHQAKSQSTLLVKNALHVGQRRTRHACASQRLAFAMLPLQLWRLSVILKASGQWQRVFWFLA